MPSPRCSSSAGPARSRWWARCCTRRSGSPDRHGAAGTGGGRRVTVCSSPGAPVAQGAVPVSGVPVSGSPPPVGVVRTSRTRWATRCPGGATYGTPAAGATTRTRRGWLVTVAVVVVLLMIGGGGYLWLNQTTGLVIGRHGSTGADTSVRASANRAPSGTAVAVKYTAQACRRTLCDRSIYPAQPDVRHRRVGAHRSEEPDNHHVHVRLFVHRQHLNSVTSLREGNVIFSASVFNRREPGGPHDTRTLSDNAKTERPEVDRGLRGRRPRLRPPAVRRRQPQPTATYMLEARDANLLWQDHAHRDPGSPASHGPTPKAPRAEPAHRRGSRRQTPKLHSG